VAGSNPVSIMDCHEPEGSRRTTLTTENWKLTTKATERSEAMEQEQLTDKQMIEHLYKRVLNLEDENTKLKERVTILEYFHQDCYVNTSVDKGED